MLHLSVARKSGLLGAATALSAAGLLPAKSASGSAWVSDNRISRLSVRSDP
jgi:hypothetical protein